MFIRNSTWSLMLMAEMYMHNGDGLRDGPGQWPKWWIYREQAVRTWMYVHGLGGQVHGLGWEVMT